MKYRINLCFMSLCVASILFPQYLSAGDFVTRKGELLINTEWGISIKLPGAKIWEDYPYKDSPAYVLAAHFTSQKCNINLSMQAISMPIGAGAAECWKTNKAAPTSKGSALPGMKIHEISEKPVPHSLYDMILETEKSDSDLKFTNNQLWAYWSRSDQCFALHVSSVQCADFATKIKPLLKAVKIEGTKDVTVETVAVAREENLNSDGWQAHLLVGSYYLHQARPPQPEKARRFFESSKQLSRNERNAMQQWSIEEGIGLSYLMQDEGGKALKPLLAARDHAENGGQNKKTMLTSTLHNLACAQSLSGNIKAACGSLRSLFKLHSGADLAAVFDEINGDPQLERVRKATCYQTIQKKDSI